MAALFGDFSREATFDFGSAMSCGDPRSEMYLDDQPDTETMEPAEVDPRDLCFNRVVDCDSRCVVALCGVRGAEHQALVRLELDQSSPELIAGLFGPGKEAEVSRGLFRGLPDDAVSTSARVARFAGPVTGTGALSILFPVPPEPCGEWGPLLPQRSVLIRETRHLWEAAVRPLAVQRQQASARWLQQVLTEPSASVMLDDTEWRVLLDSKVDPSSPATWSAMALLKRPPPGDAPLSCLRDLRQHHVDAMLRVRDAVTAEFARRFSLGADHLVCYCEYPPQLWHFHIMFSHVDHVAITGGQAVCAGKVHLLDDICENLRLRSDHYYVRTLAVMVPERTELHALYTKHALAAAAAAASPSASPTRRAPAAGAPAADCPTPPPSPPEARVQPAGVVPSPDDDYL
eukprot:TRINITY_DN2441_c2_g1_i1.p1 TRINITY_DN2441_c2_g1~~TRINITY_DN2441_c2_g1_i1.p1  ORF type:complete len:429 (+),score=90.63 TRINITY_DN2441_c2_g1_i1:84-1289(+)